MSGDGLDSVRGFFAKLMAAASGSSDPRLERIFELVPREAFMGPGPWHIQAGRQYVPTPDNDPRHLYQNVLVALDSDKGINNGEPFLHARWIGLAEPQSGEHVVHIGAGTGYYTAILSMLVLPNGHVDAYEIDESLAVEAKRNLQPFENVSVVAGNAVSLRLPPCDLIYVNAGVSELPHHWLEALKPGGRLVFPWCPTDGGGVAVVVKRTADGFAAKPIMPVRFIPCVGASATVPGDETAPETAWRLRSVHIRAARPPDASAIAVYQRIWFSSEPVAA